MKSIDDILFKVELLRNELHYLAEKRGLNHPSVIESSQRLDKLINEYNLLRSSVSKTMLKTG